MDLIFQSFNKKIIIGPIKKATTKYEIIQFLLSFTIFHVRKPQSIISMWFDVPFLLLFLAQSIPFFGHIHYPSTLLMSSLPFVIIFYFKCLIRNFAIFAAACQFNQFGMYMYVCVCFFLHPTICSIKIKCSLAIWFVKIILTIGAKRVRIFSHAKPHCEEEKNTIGDSHNDNNNNKKQWKQQQHGIWLILKCVWRVKFVTNIICAHTHTPARHAMCIYVCVCGRSDGRSVGRARPLDHSIVDFFISFGMDGVTSRWRWRYVVSVVVVVAVVVFIFHMERSIARALTIRWWSICEKIEMTTTMMMALLAYILLAFQSKQSNNIH